MQAPVREPIAVVLMADPPVRRRRRRLRGWLPRLLPRSYSTPGLAMAVAFACMSLTPSLMPRSPAFQGVVSGLSAGCGYGIGLLLVRAGGRRLKRRVTPRLRQLGRWSVACTSPLVLALFLLASAGWQQQVHRLVGLPPPGEYSPVLVVTVAVALFTAITALARGLLRLTRLVRRPMLGRVPHTLAGAVSVLLVAFVVGALLDQVVARSVLAAVDRSFDSTNNAVPAGLEPPALSLRSGGPGSLSSWTALGVEGRTFVSSGPDAERIREVTGRPAREPIRVYAGLDTADDLERLAAVAVQELERTGAFERSVLCVVTATGRGWVNPRAAQALEYLHGGDTAIVAMQYSYLPSPLAFLVDPERAKEAGQQLFDQVHARWSALPPEGRPRLVVYGESLGSTGAAAAFSGLGDVRSRTDGALFVGPPASNTLWSELVARRDRGSSQVLPVYEEGQTARFVAHPSQLATAGGGVWDAPRVLFLQHASDPVVWWSPELLLRRPDWLEEPRGPDVSGAMRWYPLVTFWQVTADVAVANATPFGHGHRYDGFVEHWAALVPPTGWEDTDTARLAASLRQ